MAIARLKPDSLPVTEKTTPTTIQEPSKSIFTTLIPEAKIDTLLKYVEGHPWSVNYYGQILNTNNTVEHFDPTSPNMSQTYYKVKGLILNVSSPLSTSYDESTGITAVSGSALTPFKLVPNVGDLFLAQVDTGEDAIFHIVSVVRKTHRKESLYEVSYNLYSYTSQNPEFITTLESKINETYYFNNDTNFYNRDVLIKPSVQEARTRLRAFLADSMSYYFKTFSQPRTGSLLVPGTGTTTYDDNLVSFISKTVEYSTISEARFFRPTHNSIELNQETIYDSLLNRTVPHESTTVTRVIPVEVHWLRNRAKLGTVQHVGIRDILFPVEPFLDHLSNYKLITPERSSTPIVNETNHQVTEETVIKTTNNNTVYEKNTLHNLFTDDYYVVSKNFYNYLKDNSVYESVSYVEFLVAKFLRKEAIPVEDLAVTIENWKSWSILHRFYLLPVMWLMIRTYL